MLAHAVAHTPGAVQMQLLKASSAGCWPGGLFVSQHWKHASADAEAEQSAPGGGPPSGGGGALASTTGGGSTCDGAAVEGGCVVEPPVFVPDPGDGLLPAVESSVFLPSDGGALEHATVTAAIRVITETSAQVRLRMHALAARDGPVDRCGGNLHENALNPGRSSHLDVHDLDPSAWC